VRALLTAFGFLTAVPVPSPEIRPGDLGRATAWFPLVGVFVGLLLAGVDWCGRAVWGPYVASALVLGATLLLTGGLHIDGFMDSADGFFSRRDREGVLAVMKDSRSGALGVAAGVSLLLLKFAAYGQLVGVHHWQAIALAPVLGRLAMTLAVASFPYARQAGTGLTFAQETRGRHAIAATVMTLAFSFGFLQYLGLAFAAGAAMLTLLCSGYWMRRLGGLTGDIYGSINEIVEVAALLAGAAIIAR